MGLSVSAAASVAGNTSISVVTGRNPFGSSSVKRQTANRPAWSPLSTPSSIGIRISTCSPGAPRMGTSRNFRIIVM
jgi:hypothetical protein